MLKKWILGLTGIALAIQIVAPERTNPIVEAEPDAPPAVLAVLRRACYDCHSHQTVWPWYASVAPASWLVVHDVNEARAHLNLSRWTSLEPDDQIHARREMWHEIEIGHMPLWYYLALHPDARLDESDKQAVRGWLLAER